MGAGDPGAAANKTLGLTTAVGLGGTPAPGEVPGRSQSGQKRRALPPDPGCGSSAAEGRPNASRAQLLPAPARKAGTNQTASSYLRGNPGWGMGALARRPQHVVEEAGQARKTALSPAPLIKWWLRDTAKNSNKY